MDWPIATMYGAVGGALVELVALGGSMIAWQRARRSAYENDEALPQLVEDGYVDPPADILVALTRVVLGALAGMAFHGSVTGELAAIAVGASAPALLQQFGNARNLHEAVAVRGGRN